MDVSKLRINTVNGRLADVINPKYYPNNMTHWYKVESSNIKAMMHNKEANMLFVEFNSGAVYTYLGVNKVLFTKILNSASRGHEFYVQIRSKPQIYPYKNGGTIADYAPVQYETENGELPRGALVNPDYPVD